MPKVKRLILGITGGIASGKTTVLRLLARRGIPTISSDELAHMCLRRGKPPFRAVVHHFGKGMVSAQGQIDRKKLGEIVFANSKERRALEKMVHPCVVKGLRAFIRRHPRGVIALDIPLLFEAKLKGLVDKTVVIFSTRDQQLLRLRRRSSLSRKDALLRIRAQMPLRQKRRLADVVLQNTGTLLQLQRKVTSHLSFK